MGFLTRWFLFERLGTIRLRYDSKKDGTDKWSIYFPYLIEIQKGFWIFKCWEQLHEFETLRQANKRLSLIARGTVLYDGSTVIAKASPTASEEKRMPDLFDHSG